MIYKNNFKTLISIFVLGALILPAISSASPSSSSTPKVGKGSGNFCVNITDKLTKQNKDLFERWAKFEDNKAGQLKRISENRLNVDEKRLAVRTKVDANRDERITKLEALATTTAEKAAIATFRATLASATETYRLAIEEAMKAYRASVDQALSMRKTAIEAARITLKTSVDALLAKAKTDCANGVDLQIVRKSTNDGIRATREQFRKDLQNLDKVKTTINSSTEARKTAVTKAREFRMAYEKAIADLHDTFKN